MFKLLNEENAFTLLELIVVIAIIAILSAVIVPQISDVRGDAKLSQVQINLRNMKVAIEKYYLNNGNYPSSLSEAEVNNVNDYYFNSSSAGYVIAYDGGETTGTFEDDDKLPDGNWYYITNESSIPLTTTTNADISIP